MSYNAGDRLHVRELSKAAKVAATERKEIIRGLMSLPAGRAWTLDLLEACHVFASSYCGNALQTAFNEGERNIGLRLLADIMSACPERYLLMIQEQNARNLTERPADPAEPDGGDSGPVDIEGYVEPTE